jgi:hypothetical protein
MLVDLAVDRKVENMWLTDNGYFLDPLKKDIEHVLLKVGLVTISKDTEKRFQSIL